MHAHRRRNTTSLGFLAGSVSTIIRTPAVGELHAQTTWRGLVVAPEQRCSPYDADDYRYPQSVEDRIVAEMGGVYGPYTQMVREPVRHGHRTHGGPRCRCVPRSA